MGCFATAGIGLMLKKRAVHQRFLINVPANLGDVEIAGTLLKD